MSGPFKMKGFSGFKSSMKQRDTSLTGGRDENVVHGGQVSALNPQYVPGHQITSSGDSDGDKKNKKKKRKFDFSKWKLELYKDNKRII